MTLLALLEGWAGLAVAIPAAVAVLWALWRKLRVKIKRLDALIDTLCGRDPIVHPETGEELSPSTPDIGARLAKVEDAIVSLADTHAELAALHRRIDGVEERLDEHVNDTAAA